MHELLFFVHEQDSGAVAFRLEFGYTMAKSAWGFVMLVRIAIVEDEEQLHDYYQKMLEVWGEANNVRLSLTYVGSSEEFLFKYDRQNIFDIIFLDVWMNDMNGMELAHEIRKYDQNVQIVFLTGNSEYVFEGYEIGAVRYLIKPIDESKLGQAMDACMEKLRKRTGDYFAIKYLGENLKLSRGEIIYVKVEGHYLQMQTVSKQYEWKASLKEMLAKLDSDRFVMANRSVVVNLEYVSKITREECILENGEAIPVSRGAYAGLNDAFMKYFFKE